VSCSTFRKLIRILRAQEKAATVVQEENMRGSKEVDDVAYGDARKIR
jgi:hypothetical protein